MKKISLIYSILICLIISTSVQGQSKKKQIELLNGKLDSLNVVVSNERNNHIQAVQLKDSLISSQKEQLNQLIQGNDRLNTQLDEIERISAVQDSLVKFYKDENYQLVVAQDSVLKFYVERYPLDQFFGWDGELLSYRAKEFENAVNKRLDMGYYSDIEVTNRTLIPFKGTMTYISFFENEPFIKLNITSGSLRGASRTLLYDTNQEFDKAKSLSFRQYISKNSSFLLDQDCNVKVGGYFIEGECESFNYPDEKTITHPCLRFVYLTLSP